MSGARQHKSSPASPTRPQASTGAWPLVLASLVALLIHQVACEQQPLDRPQPPPPKASPQQQHPSASFQLYNPSSSLPANQKQYVAVSSSATQAAASVAAAAQPPQPALVVAAAAPQRSPLTATMSSHHTTNSATINSNSNNNNLLVSSNLQQQQIFSNQNLNAAQSLPLTRQQRQHQPQHQQVDLDNVIESTTSIVSTLHQNANIKAFSPEQQAYQAQQTICQLPPTWAGKWYQANKEPIRITNSEISDKGLCRDQKGDKYLFEFSGNSKQQQPCLVCLVINERHLNVLQYKESSCQPIRPSYYNRSTNSLSSEDDHSVLDEICSDITGDAQLESLFRLETPAIECPISGPFAFTYDNCRDTQSTLDSCIDKKQLNFKFSACPDVAGSESKSEVLKCYADWSEGNNYYMIGRLEHTSNHQDKGKFRCFIYEKSSDGKTIQMAQSVEESCSGLFPNEGPKTLRLTPKPPATLKCHFPSFIQSQSDNWLSVDNSLIYMFNQNSTKYQVKETKEGNVIEEATCLQQFTSSQAHLHPHFHHQSSNPQQARSSSTSNGGNSNSISNQVNRRYPSQATNYLQVDQSTSSRQTVNDVVYMIQITKNCHTTNYCVRFYKRSNGIVQIDYFPASLQAAEPCRNAYTSTPQTQIITSTNLEYQRCPFEGAYAIGAPIESDLTYNPSNIFVCPRQSFITAQCDHPARLRIHSGCSPSKMLIRNLYCLGSWTANGLVRLLLADDDRQRYSAWYRDYNLGSAQPQAADLQDVPNSQPQALRLQAPTSKSQHLLSAATGSGGSPNTANVNNQLLNSLPNIVDLQLSLITALPIVTKPVQVRLTRRGQCSDLRGYTSQGSLNGVSMQSAISSYPFQSYTSSATISSAAHPISGFLQHTGLLISTVITLLMIIL